MFSKNSLTQISGFDNPIISSELVYQQQTYWNLTITNSDDVPVDITGATISAQIVRRQLSNVVDTRYGLSFDIADYTPAPSPITLTISNRIDAEGKFTVVINDSTWATLSSDDQFAINSSTGAAVSYTHLTLPTILLV